MARFSSFLLAFLLAATLAPPALARKHRRLGYYGMGSTPTPSSSSPVFPTPTPSTPSPSTQYPSPSTPSSTSPTTSSPSPYVTPVTPSTPSPYVTPSTPSPVVSSPSPVVMPPATSSPTGGYGGYGSRSGTGTSGYWASNPWKVPKILSLLSTVVRIFGGSALKYFGNRTTLYGALKDSNPDAMSALAREGTASLINAYAVSGFPLSTENVLMLFSNALSSPEQAAQQATIFQQLNEAV